MLMNNALSKLQKDPLAREILQLRAKELAAQHTDEQPTEHHSLEDFIHFRLAGKEDYGIPYDVIEEVLVVNRIAKVPCSPAHISGVVNRRGDMLTIINMRQLLHVAGDIPAGDQSHIIVIKTGTLLVGLHVDELVGNSMFSRAALAPAPQSANAKDSNYFVGIHMGRISMLNIPSIIGDMG